MLGNLGKSLLSSTLRRILSRYLLDVNVETLSLFDGGLSADFQLVDVVPKDGVLLFSSEKRRPRSAPRAREDWLCFSGGSKEGEEEGERECLVVRVGRGGNIGRLRLRLEGGKDLRVDAEDVDLVVEVATECCTKKEQETEDEETGGLGRSMALVPWLTLKNFRLRILFKRPQGDLEVILNCGCLEITDDERQPHADHQFSHKKLTLGGGNEGFSLSLSSSPSPSVDAPRRAWARHKWQSCVGEDLVLLRVSSLVFLARVHLQSKPQDTFLYSVDSEQERLYDEVTIDSMLFGLDYMAPVGNIATKNVDPNLLGLLEDYDGTSFWRYADGYRRLLDRAQAMPLEDHHSRWVDQRGQEYSGDEEDNKIPLAGLVLHLQVDEVLQINLDEERLSILKSISDLLLSKDDQQHDQQDAQNDTQQQDTHHSPLIHEMTPNSCMLCGIQISKIQINLQDMDQPNPSTFHTFRYWELTLTSLSLHFHHYKDPSSFQDLAFLVSSISLQYHKGVETHLLLSVPSSPTPPLRHLHPFTAFQIFSLPPCPSNPALQLRFLKSTFETLEVHLPHLSLSGTTGAFHRLLNTTQLLLSLRRSSPPPLPSSKHYQITLSVSCSFPPLSLKTQPTTLSANLSHWNGVGELAHACDSFLGVEISYESTRRKRNPLDLAPNLRLRVLTYLDGFALTAVEGLCKRGWKKRRKKARLFRQRSEEESLFWRCLVLNKYFEENRRNNEAGNALDF